MKEKSKKNILTSYPAMIIIGVLVGLLFNIFFGIVRVNGSSMNPTLVNGQILMMQKKNVEYKVGDIVVAKIVRFDTGKDETIIKRVIAVGGQTIEIVDGKIYVDNILIEEDYIAEEMYEGQTMEAITLEEDEVFLMGDNRNHSLDSRIQGAIKTSDLKGKILFK